MTIHNKKMVKSTMAIRNIFLDRILERGFGTTFFTTLEFAFETLEFAFETLEFSFETLVLGFMFFLKKEFILYSHIFFYV